MLLSSGVALAFLLIEWLVVARLGMQLDQGEISRTLLALALAAMAAGAGGVVAAGLLGRWFSAPAVSIAAPVAALLMLDLYFALGTHPEPAAKLLGSVGFALVVFLVLVWLIQRGPDWLQQTVRWWGLAAVLASLPLLQTAMNAVDNTGTLLAAGAAVVAIALLLQGLRSGKVLWPVLSVLTVLAAAAVLGTRVPVWQPVNQYAEGKPSVLLVTIDTLRADHVGAYGHVEARTPNFDALAKQGVRFSQTVTANVFTGPSHTSILSGLLPQNHGVLINHMIPPAAVPTLADILREEGYVTGAFVSGYTTRDNTCGLPSRFQSFDDDIRPFRWLPVAAGRLGVMDLAIHLYKKFGSYNGHIGQPYRMGEDTADVAVAWLKQNGKRPFFVWTHFFDPHLPYRPPAEFRRGDDQGLSGLWYALDAQERLDVVESRSKVDAMIALYDAEVAYADAQLGRVVEAAREMAPDGNLLIVVTSDHGESMGEHDLYWFRFVYDPTLMVPLVIVPPDSTPFSRSVVDTQVRLIDIAPTVLDILDLDAGTAFDGASMLALMQGDGSDVPRPAISSRYSRNGEFERDRHSVRDRGWKLIKAKPGWDGGNTPYEKEARELYRLAADPGELSNLMDTGVPVQQELEQQLDDVIGEGVTLDMELTDEERENLRSLGYIQ